MNLSALGEPNSRFEMKCSSHTSSIDFVMKEETSDIDVDRCVQEGGHLTHTSSIDFVMKEETSDIDVDRCVQEECHLTHTSNIDFVKKEETSDIDVDRCVQEGGKSLPSERDLQDLRFDNLKSLLPKSSRYAELLLVKVKKNEEKQSKRGRKRKNLETGGSNPKKKPSSDQKFQMLSRAELETLVACEGSKQEEKDDEHLQEFDEPKNFTGGFRKIHSCKSVL